MAVPSLPPHLAAAGAVGPSLPNARCDGRPVGATACLCHPRPGAGHPAAPDPSLNEVGMRKETFTHDSSPRGEFPWNN